MSDAIFRESEQKMRNAIDAVKREFSKLRAGKASPALLEACGWRRTDRRRRSIRWGR
jgi:ribosome recycling factor